MTGPDRIERYDPDYGGSMCRDDWWGEWVRYEDHTAALSAEYARGLRDAVDAVRSVIANSPVNEWGQEGISMARANERAILALIPLSPSPVDASRGADPDNKEPTDD